MESARKMESLLGRPKHATAAAAKSALRRPVRCPAAPNQMTPAILVFPLRPIAGELCSLLLHSWRLFFLFPSLREREHSPAAVNSFCESIEYILAGFSAFEAPTNSHTDRSESFSDPRSH